MRTIKHILLFINNNLIQVKRKSFVLPLILLFPMAIIAMLAFVVITFITPSEQGSIQIGLVDLDQTEETQLVMMLLEETQHIVDFISVQQMTEQTAQDKLHNNELTAYIIFPEQFADRLFEGEHINLQIFGNEKQGTESLLVQSFINSVATHINSAQANITVINDYMKELDYTWDERRPILLEQFQSYLIFTLTKDAVIKESTVQNSASESPFAYYIIASWLITSTVWLFMFYNFFEKNTTHRMQERMRLYNVTIFQQLLAKAIVSLLITTILAAGLFGATHFILDYMLAAEDYLKFLGITLLYFTSIIFMLVSVELLIRSEKLLLVVQLLLTFGLLVISGAFVPTIYFPVYVQNVLGQSFSSVYFDQTLNLLLSGDAIHHFSLLGITAAAAFTLFGLLAFWKERGGR